MEDVASMSRTRWVWLTAAALLVAGGTVGSLLGASVVAHNDGERSRQALDSSSMAISSTLKLAIQQENNLVISAKAFVVSNPNASNSEFLSWANSMQLRKRFPEVGGIGFDAVVRPEQLTQFVARTMLDPPSPLPAGQSYEITPAGSRPFYCLSDLGLNTGVGITLPLGYDSCAADTSAARSPDFSPATHISRTSWEARPSWPLKRRSTQAVSSRQRRRLAPQPLSASWAW